MMEEDLKDNESILETPFESEEDDGLITTAATKRDWTGGYFDCDTSDSELTSRASSLMSSELNRGSSNVKMVGLEVKSCV
eukprot:UN32256